MTPPKPRVGEEREREREELADFLSRFAYGLKGTIGMATIQDLHRIAAILRGSGREGISAQDRKDLRLGKLVRGMEPGSLLYRGVDYWAHELKARIGAEEIVESTPEAALAAKKRKGA